MRAMLFLLIVLAGCASPPPPKPQIDTQCDKLAKYARAVAHLRDIGVTREDIRAYTTEPVVMTFPLQAVQHDVYMNLVYDPQLTEQRYYEGCVKVGYANMFTKLRNDERERQRKESQ